jgi:hypothetical protein
MAGINSQEQFPFPHEADEIIVINFLDKNK